MTSYSDEFAAACIAAFSAPGVHVVDKADLPEHVDGQWRCGRCKAPMFGTGRCLACWPEEVRVADDPAPTTGGPLGEEYDLPEGCVCYWREDVEYGDVRTAPREGCRLHTPWAFPGYSLTQELTP